MSIGDQIEHLEDQLEGFRPPVQPGKTFLRFTKTEILLHWGHGLPFLVLLASGLALAVQGLFLQERSEFISDLHKLFGILLILAPPLVSIIGNTRTILDNLRQILTIEKRDIEWIKAQPKKLHVAAGKFNMGQKINSLLMMGISLTLQATGIWLWLFPQGMLPRWSHTLIALGSIGLLSGHIFMATINPSTRKGFMGIIHGVVPISYVKEHHSLQLGESEEGHDH
ncbi:MAG: cytochrome b/b6 domain-containing protein [bacterium]|nr:cytochrome b/b6 domain-containing protein [bacterium]